MDFNKNYSMKISLTQKSQSTTATTAKYLICQKWQIRYFALVTAVAVWIVTKIILIKNT
jgi:hypothetical protein